MKIETSDLEALGYGNPWASQAQRAGDKRDLGIALQKARFRPNKSPSADKRTKRTPSPAELDTRAHTRRMNAAKRHGLKRASTAAQWASFEATSRQAGARKHLRWEIQGTDLKVTVDNGAEIVFMPNGRVQRVRGLREWHEAFFRAPEGFFRTRAGPATDEEIDRELNRGGSNG